MLFRAIFVALTKELRLIVFFMMHNILWKNMGLQFEFSETYDAKDFVCFSILIINYSAQYRIQILYSDLEQIINGEGIDAGKKCRLTQSSNILLFLE